MRKYGRREQILVERRGKKTRFARMEEINTENYKEVVYRIRRQCVDKRISKMRSVKLGSKKEKIMRKL